MGNQLFVIQIEWMFNLCSKLVHGYCFIAEDYG